MIRSDPGTENTSLATIQIAFRFRQTDSSNGKKSFFMDHPVQCGMYNDCNIILLRLQFTLIFFVTDIEN